MSNRPTAGEAAARAEARRRARRAARGEVDGPAVADQNAVDEEPARRESFLRRLFPAAPPLPDRPDPLGDFRYEGPLRPIAEGVYLLRANPLAWLLPAAVWFAARVIDPTGSRLIGFPVSLLALGAAGWFGWQRPALYGATAATLGFLALVVVVLVSFASQGAPPETFGSNAAIVLSLTVQGVVEAAVGLLTGWYGGYLRRRSAQVRTAEGRRRRRR